jgi:cytochrome c-type biogenesis protein CcmE
MKKTYIVTFLLLAAAIYFLVGASKDMTVYSTFSDAEKTEKRVKIVGVLSKDKAMVYNPEVDPNRFSFFLKDSEGIERQVILLDAKPQDFERSEQIVVTGKLVDGEFFATDMLLKCPSKYKDEELYLRES